MSEIKLNLSEEQIAFLQKTAGSENVEAILTSQVSLGIVKNKLVEYVPQLTEKDKEELREFVAKKFRLQPIENTSSGNTSTKADKKDNATASASAE